MVWRVGGYVKASPWYTATSLHSDLTYLTLLTYLTRDKNSPTSPKGYPKETRGERLVASG